MQLGRHDDVEAILSALPGSDPEARAIRARSALERGDVAAAAALLAEGPADHPGLARLRGRLALARRQGAEAVRHFRAALAAEPDDRDALSGLGAALRLVGDAAAAEPVEKAARDLDRLGGLIQRAASSANRNDPRLLHDLGAACEAVGRRPEARAWYRLAIAQDPLDRESQRPCSASMKRKRCHAKAQRRKEGQQRKTRKLNIPAFSSLLSLPLRLCAFA